MLISHFVALMWICKRKNWLLLKCSDPKEFNEFESHIAYLFLTPSSLNRDTAVP